MRLIYTLINRTNILEGILEFKIELEKQDYLLIKQFEYRENVISITFQEEVLKNTSDNLTVEKEKFNNNIVFFHLKTEIFEKLENKEIWQSKKFTIEYKIMNFRPSHLLNKYKDLIEEKMKDMKSRRQPDDDSCFEEVANVEY